MEPSAERLAQFVAHRHRRGFVLDGIKTYKSAMGAIFMDQGLTPSAWTEMSSSRIVKRVEHACATQQAILGRVTKHAPAITEQQVHESVIGLKDRRGMINFFSLQWS